MAELVGGAILQAVFGVLLERLTPDAEFLNFIRGMKLDKNLLHRLKPTLNAARAVLNDAELKQFKDPAVKEWLYDLKDAVYEVQDLIDDISTQTQVCDFSSASLKVNDRDMRIKLEAITDRLELIVKHKDILGLKTNSEPQPQLMFGRTESTSRVKVSDVCGREKEKDAIIKLMSDNNDKLCVIPIVGMGGIGKTTLAQLVYNDDYVKQTFDLKAWVCVSEAFDILKITQTIIRTISPNHAFDERMDLNLLQLDLEEKLSKRKFLVVLDDVWNDKYTDWDTLMTPFDNGVEGSKILVTTRIETVAFMVKTIPSFYRLGLLSNEDCLSVFARHAFHSRDSYSNSYLEKIGGEIVSKCKGLPLAAKALGGLFRSKPDIKYWDAILKNDLWDLVEDEFVPALRVSYHYLPSHLKQCFVYCSLFPKDYEFEKEDLILMWMAEGFLHPSNRGMMSLEEVGSDYFDDLTSRSFFQPLRWSNERFVMHDLIHDLAICVGGDFFFRLEKEGEGNKIGSRTRHLSYINLNFPSSDDVESLKRAKALRTILGFDSQWIPGSIGNTIMQLDLKYLRVLSFHNFKSLKTIPDSIGEFIHLHYLDLSQTSIVRLPDSLCKLYNLQTLKLHYCNNLEMLPNDMHDLVNLRYLGFFGTRVKEMPRGMSKLKNLQFLSEFIVGKEPEAANIGELGEMQNLMNGIKISKLENIKNGKEACKGRMMEKQDIRRLRLSWSSGDCINDSRTEKDILDNLQPHWGLEGLTIEGYRGTIFPNWLGSRSYNNMTLLRLEKCENCWMLPSLGQLPALRKLCIRGFDGVVSIGVEFFKGDDCASVIPFSSLECLEIEDMSAWEEWHSIEIEAFPKLRWLHIFRCPKLTGSLPIQLVSLVGLTVSECPLLCCFIPRCPKIQALGISGSENVVLQEQVLPPSLRHLKISGNGMLEAMAHSEVVHIKELGLWDCCNAISFPVVRMPQSVTRLSIGNCKEVESLKQECEMSQKEASVTSSFLPIEMSPILDYLYIAECHNLISVLVSDTPLQNLRSISIYSCKNLKWLSNESEYLLPTLKVLSIHSCPEVEPFPEGFLPSSLRELRIGNCKKVLAHHTEWHLPSITSLTIRDFNPDTVKCFPEGCSLPPTLTTLKLDSVTSLETLNCEGLQHLTSLQELRIDRCRKLKKMEGEKLPTSLRKLIIDRCDLLEQRCRNKDQEIWPKISHTPAIRLSDEWFSFHPTTHRLR